LSELANIDPSVGIIVLEILPVSFRITLPPPDHEVVLSAIRVIFDYHNFQEVVVISHSYGSTITTHMIHSPTLSPRISSVVLIDPVTILLHLPDVAYNFMYRTPRAANEWQLWYFASMDMGVSHALARHFFWGENILWKDELTALGRPTAVVLSGQDQISSPHDILRYLTGKDCEDNGRAVDVIPFSDVDDGRCNVWFVPGIDHAQVFEAKARREMLVGIVSGFAEQ
jgi:pimeloyl-ACP methyl ester carboxylesterase